MSLPLRTAAAVTTALVAAASLTLATSPARAQVNMIETGTPGQVSRLNFTGGSEAAPHTRADVGAASVQCDANARARRAVFAGALAWAPDDTPGLHNDWRYVRVAAGAVDHRGHTRTGQISPYFAAYDDRAATLPAVGVLLPRDGDSYTPVLVVQFYDATYRLTGSTVVGAQTGAWRVRLAAPALGDYWYVAATDLVQCD